MKNLRAVLFDLDDTLTDRARSIDRLAIEFAERFKRELDSAACEEIVRCIHAGDGGGYATREALAEHLRASLRWRIRPGATEIVAFRRERFPR